MISDSDKLLNNATRGITLADGNPGTILSLKTLLEAQNKYYQQGYLQNKTQISDLSDATELAQLLKTFDIAFISLLSAFDFEIRNGFPQYAKGEYLNLNGQEYDIYRTEGSYAKGYVTIIPKEIPAKQVLMKAGTIFSCKIPRSADSDVRFDILKYKLLEDLYINPGLLVKKNVQLQAVEIGEMYNIKPNQVWKVDEQGYEFGFKITNDNWFDGGIDVENDNQFSARIIETRKIPSIGSIIYYQQLIKELNTNIWDVKLINNLDIFTPYITFNTMNRQPISDINTLLESINLKVSSPFNKLINHTFNDCKIATNNYICFNIIVPYILSDTQKVWQKDIYLDFQRLLDAYVNGTPYNVSFNNHEGYKIGQQKEKYIGTWSDHLTQYLQMNNILSFCGINDYTEIDFKISTQLNNWTGDWIKPNMSIPQISDNDVLTYNVNSDFYINGDKITYIEDL